MQEAGTILHIAGSGRVIVRLTGGASEGDILCDSQGTRVARIREIIGPVDAPYASAEPITNSIRRYIGGTVSIAPKSRRRER